MVQTFPAHPLVRLQGQADRLGALLVALPRFPALVIAKGEGLDVSLDDHGVLAGIEVTEPVAPGARLTAEFRELVLRCRRALLVPEGSPCDEWRWFPPADAFTPRLAPVDDPATLAAREIVGTGRSHTVRAEARAGGALVDLVIGDTTGLGATEVEAHVRAALLRATDDAAAQVALSPDHPAAAELLANPYREEEA